MTTATTERKAKNNYVRGGGMLTIAPRDTTGPLAGFLPGNVPTLTLERTIETSEHKEAISGSFETDETTVTGRDTKIKAKLESMTIQNFALFLGATLETRSISATAVSAGDEELRGARRGGYWRLGVSSTYPEGKGAITTFSSLAIKATARANSTAYAVGTVISASSVAYVVTATAGAGLSGASAPSYPTAGGTATDGDLTIKHLGPVTVDSSEYIVNTVVGSLQLTGAADDDIQLAIDRMPSGYTLTLLPAYTPTAQTVQRIVPLASTQQYTVYFTGQTTSGTALSFCVPYATIIGSGSSEWINATDPQSFEIEISCLKLDTTNEAVIPSGNTASIPWS
jgi:hypothetical protein